MALKNNDNTAAVKLTRRHFLQLMAAGSLGTVLSPLLLPGCGCRKPQAKTFIGKAAGYDRDIAGIIRAGFTELGITPTMIKGKRVLLKPNLVETRAGASHINTHPAVIRSAVQVFRSLGAREVMLAEGPGHCRDSLLLLEESGLAEVLVEDRVPFMDLNYAEVCCAPNAGGHSRLNPLIFPRVLKNVDFIISMAKMKTHHWAGVTLSMKNLFGVMPGCYYGWAPSPTVSYSSGERPFPRCGPGSPWRIKYPPFGTYGKPG